MQRWLCSACPAFFQKERSVAAEEIGNDAALTAYPVSAEEYGTFRELRLLDRAHAISSDGMLSQQKTVSLGAGADLYAVDTPNGTACAAVAVNGAGEALCLEFLAPEGEEDGVLAAIHRRVKAKRYALRMPINEIGEGRPFGMLKWYDADKAMKWAGTKNAWFGLALD